MNQEINVLPGTSAATIQSGDVTCSGGYLGDPKETRDSQHEKKVLWKLWS